MWNFIKVVIFTIHLKVTPDAVLEFDLYVFLKNNLA